jgi:hypothetical protein
MELLNCTVPPMKATYRINLNLIASVSLSTLRGECKLRSSILSPTSYCYVFLEIFCSARRSQTSSVKVPSYAQFLVFVLYFRDDNLTMWQHLG